MTSVEIIPHVDKHGNKKYVRRIGSFLNEDQYGVKFNCPIAIIGNKKIHDYVDKRKQYMKKRPFLNMNVRFANHDTVVKIKFCPQTIGMDGKLAPPDKGTWKVEFPPHEIRERGPFKPIKRFESNLEIFDSHENFAIWLAAKFGEAKRDEILNHFAKAIIGKPKKGKRK